MVFGIFQQFTSHTFITILFCLLFQFSQFGVSEGKSNIINQNTNTYEQKLNLNCFYLCQVHVCVCVCVCLWDLNNKQIYNIDESKWIEWMNEWVIWQKSEQTSTALHFFYTIPPHCISHSHLLLLSLELVVHRGWHFHFIFNPSPRTLFLSHWLSVQLLTICADCCACCAFWPAVALGWTMRVQCQTRPTWWLSGLPHDWGPLNVRWRHGYPDCWPASTEVPDWWLNEKHTIQYLLFSWSVQTKIIFFD